MYKARLCSGHKRRRGEGLRSVLVFIIRLLCTCPCISVIKRDRYDYAMRMYKRDEAEGLRRGAAVLA
jgi:hypothetical protein